MAPIDLSPLQLDPLDAIGAVTSIQPGELS